MHGQERPEDVSAEVRATWIPGRTFHEKSVWPRAIIVAAGPVANFLLAMVLFAGCSSASGMPVTLPVVGEVLPDSCRRACRTAGQRPDRRYRRPADA